jgi:hypothetical protein
MAVPNQLAKWLTQSLERLALVTWLYLLLCSVYEHVIVNIYNFGGFTRSVDTAHWGLLLLLLVSFAVPRRISNAKDLFVLVSFFFLLLPASVLYTMQQNGYEFYIVMSFAMPAVIAFWWVSRKAFAVYASNKKVSDNNKQRSNALFSALLVSIVCFVAITTPIPFSLSFADVYEYRFIFNEWLKFPLNYMIPFVGGPLAAYLVAAAASRRQWAMVCGLLFIGLLLFGFTSHKAYLFYPLCALAIYWALTLQLNVFRALTIIITLGCLSALFLNKALGDSAAAFFANRLMFIPAKIHFEFFDEFSRIGFLYWAESKVGLGLHRSPLSLSSVNHIGYLMTGDPRIGANVGWLANGYMNLGLPGIAVYAIGLGAFLACVDALSSKIGNFVVLACFSVVIFSIITSVDLLTAMLTGGALPMVILLYLANAIPKMRVLPITSNLKSVF